MFLQKIYRKLDNGKNYSSIICFHKINANTRLLHKNILIEMFLKCGTIENYISVIVVIGSNKIVC